MNIAIVGVGGQGTVLTSRIIGGVAIAAGYNVKFSEVHGMAQRGGSVTSFVRFGREVAEPIIEEGQADILISFERLEALRYAHLLKKDGLIVVNDQRIDPVPVIIGMAEYPTGIIEGLREKYQVVAFAAIDEAKKLGESRAVNVIMLGIVAKHMEFDKQLWLDVIEKTVNPKVVELNKRAFEIGYSL